MRELTIEQKKEIENRFTYHPPRGDQAERYGLIREKAKEFAILLCQTCPPSRELSTALTQLQLGVMLANAAIACNE